MRLTPRHWVTMFALAAAAALIEWWMGRLPLGPDGTFAWWEPDIWSPHQSQRVLDPYAVTHVVHGFLFYAVLFIVARSQPTSTRLVLAVALEAVWEVLENSPVIIDRYRAVTIAQGYVGDSILNSVSDIVMCALGFLAASRLRLAWSIGAVVAMEVVMLLLIRDNLTLNVLMLVWPVDAIREWQMAGRP